MSNLLNDLAKKYGTDKFGKHNYTQVYFDLFNEQREKIQKILEIGTAEGAGLLMFKDFFPNAQIYGAEIDPKRVELLKDEDRITIYQCDQSNEMELRRLLHKTGYAFDLVIDDGSHKREDQIFTCITLMFMVNPYVTYIIEDVADPTIVDEIRKAGYSAEVKKVGKRYDDCLVIVRRRV